MYQRAQGLEFFTDPEQPGIVRFSGRPEEHLTFFLKDPSNNLIEFKIYNNEEWIFAPVVKPKLKWQEVES
jgi:extradiol dioxygenase family protein